MITKPKSVVQTTKLFKEEKIFIFENLLKIFGRCENNYVKSIENLSIQQFSQTTSIFMVKNYIIVCAGAENPRVRTLVPWLGTNETIWKVVGGGLTVDTLPIK